MKPGSLMLHLLADAAVLGAVFGFPFLTGSRPDAISGATAVIDAPSGEFVVLLNRDALTEDVFWEKFFSGQEVDFCFEDIACQVPGNDAAALEMARSFQSRLSEHQMTIRREDATLLLSKADHGKFEVLLLSKEFAAQSHAETAVSQGIIALTVGQEESP